jgi:hypothetical protein
MGGCCETGLIILVGVLVRPLLIIIILIIII